jgi:hypothetical protein
MNILDLAPLGLRDRWNCMTLAVSRLYNTDSNIINEYAAVGGMKIDRGN